MKNIRILRAILDGKRKFNHNSFPKPQGIFMMITRIASVLSVLVASTTVVLTAPAQADNDAAMAGIRQVAGRVDSPVFIVGGLEPSLQAGEITASASGRPLSIGTVTLVSRPPTDFLVLIDTSRSTRATADIRQVANILIDKMERDDRMEIATFGDDPFNQRVPMTGDKEALRDSLNWIALTDDCTKLYQALTSAAERLGRKSGPAPATTRRNAMLVVISDGEDDDPDQSAKPQRGGRCNPGTDTLLIKAQNDTASTNVPVLFVDTTRDPAKLCRSDLATRIATRGDRPDRGGGRCARLDDAGDAIRMLTTVTRIETTCRDCPNGPQTYTLHIDTQHRSLNLIREARLASPPAPQLSPPTEEQNNRSFLNEIMERPWFMALSGLLGLAVLVGAILLILSLRSRRQRNAIPVVETATANVLDPPNFTIERNPSASTQTSPNAEFVQLGNYGTEQCFLVAITKVPITLGRGSDRDITLERDSAVADTQCEFVRDQGEVLVRNLAREGPMLLAGASMPAGAGWRRLRHGDVLRVGNTDLRFSDLERAG